MQNTFQGFVCKINDIVKIKNAVLNIHSLRWALRMSLLLKNVNIFSFAPYFLASYLLIYNLYFFLQYFLNTANQYA